MDYYGLHGAGLSGLVATALRFNAVKIWELLVGAGVFGGCLKENRAGRYSEASGF